MKDSLDREGSGPLHGNDGPLLLADGRHFEEPRPNGLDGLDKLDVSGPEVPQHGLLDGGAAEQGPGGEQLLVHLGRHATIYSIFQHCSELMFD